MKEIQHLNILMKGITINGPMFHIHDNGVVNNYYNVSQDKPCQTDAIVEEVQSGQALPDVLCTPEAIALCTKLREAGMVDERMQPIGLSNAERGILAIELARRLDIQNQWQVFATLWGTTSGTLRSAYNKANDQRKTLKFIEKLKNALC